MQIKYIIIKYNNTGGIMKIAFDVMGSDNGSKNPILAAVQMIKEFKNLIIYKLF